MINLYTKVWDRAGFELATPGQCCKICFIIRNTIIAIIHGGSVVADLLVLPLLMVVLCLVLVLLFSTLCPFIFVNLLMGKRAGLWFKCLPGVL